MDVLDYLRILRRRWRLIAALCLLGAVLGGATMRLADGDQTLYRATHTLAANGSGVNLDQAAALAVTGAVPDRVAARVGGTSAGLAAQIRVVARREVSFIEVTALGSDPVRTTALADAFAEELALYMTEFRNQSATTELAAAEDRLVQVQTELAQEQAALAAALDPVQQAAIGARIEALQAETAQIEAQIDRLRATTEGATVLQTVSSAEPVPINGPEFRALFETASSAGTSEADVSAAVSGGSQLGLLPRLVLGGILGLLAGVVTAIVLERLDPRLHSKAEVESTFGWPVITEIPPLSRSQQQERVVLAHVVPRSRTAEAYRVLRSSVLFAATGTAETPARPDAEADAAPAPDGEERPEVVGRVVLVTSPSPAEGKTTTVANLAVVLGEAGARVLVVNCDFRRPSLGAYLGVDSHLAKVVDSEVPNVKVLAQVTEEPESANPADVVALQRAVIHEAQRRFDYVLLDTAPLLTTNDANEVLDTADLVVLVARAGRTTREAADRCAEVLERRKAPVLGVVLVATSEAPTGRYYYTGDYYVESDKVPATAAGLRTTGPDEGDHGDDPGAGPGGGDDDPGDDDGPSGQAPTDDGDASDAPEGDEGGTGDATDAVDQDPDVEAGDEVEAPVPVGSSDAEATDDGEATDDREATDDGEATDDEDRRTSEDGAPARAAASSNP